MIVVKNRELIIPNTEYYIGNNSDHFATERVFRLDRVTPDGIDLGNLTFALDMVFYNGDDNSIQLDRAVTDEAIFLCGKRYAPGPRPGEGPAPGA